MGVGNGSYQELNGRIIRYRGRRKEKTPEKPHRDITLMRRWMDSAPPTCKSPSTLSAGCPPRP